MSIALDIVLVVVLVACLVHGWRSGFLRSIGSIAGIVVGGCAAVLLNPLVGSLVPDGAARVVTTIVAAIVLVLIGYAVGTRIGATIGGALQRSPIGPVDRGLGAAAQLAIGALVLSALGSLAVTMQTPYIAQPAEHSVVLHTIGSVTPPAVTLTIWQLGSGAASGELPRVGDLFASKG